MDRNISDNASEPHAAEGDSASSARPDNPAASICAPEADTGQEQANPNPHPSFCPQPRVECDGGGIPVRGVVPRCSEAVERIGNDRVEGQIGYPADSVVDVSMDEREFGQVGPPGPAVQRSAQFTERAVSVVPGRLPTR